MITLVDVIEHVDDPVGLLRAIRKQLAPGGIAVIITPDVSSLAPRLLGKRWWHYRLAHVGFFNKRSMNRALAQAGLHVVRRKRAKWYFTCDYLAQRLAVYVSPLRFINRLLRKTFLYRWTVPLNLFDSWCFFVTAHE